MAQQAASHKNSNPVEYYKLLMQNNINAEKLSNLDKRFEDVNRSFGEVNRRLEYVDKKFERKLDKMDAKIDKVESKLTDKIENIQSGLIELREEGKVMRAELHLYFKVLSVGTFLAILASSIANILFG